MKLKIATLISLIVLLTGMHRASYSQTIQFINPILSGFYPDPSIVKVGADYYLVNSTFSYFPGLPLFHSKDLKNWKQIGNVIDRKSQMDFVGERMTRGLFAPGISYYNGLFYVTCTNIDHKGNFVVTAKNPAGPWSNPVWLPQVHGIDPSIFFEAGRAYLVYNSDAPDGKPLYQGHRTIRLFELDINTLKTIGDEKILVNGGVDISKKPVWIEGPHLMKRNNWYYLYAAEGGTSVNHSEVVFRSKSVYGPFIPFDQNPILTQRNLSENRTNPITSTGHAQFVEGPDQKTYAVFLGVRPYTSDYYNTGRETFIAPVEWQNDWPIINPEGGGIKYRYNANFLEVKQNALPQSGNFKYTVMFDKPLDGSMVFLRSCDTASYKVSKASGLTLKLKPETCGGLGVPSFIGKRQQHLSCTAETEMAFSPKQAVEKAGMAVFQDEKHFYFMCQSLSGSQTVLQLYKSTKDSSAAELITELPIKANVKHVKLRITAAGEYYSFEYAVNNNSWIMLKDKMDAKFLSTHEAGGFIGCMFGLYATSSGQLSSNSASFKHLQYTGNDEVYR